MRSSWVLRRAAGVMLVVALVFVVGAALASALPVLERDVLGGGGGYAEAAPYALNGTVGQALVGTDGRAPYRLCAGYWCTSAAVGAQHFGVYLPVVIK